MTHESDWGVLMDMTIVDKYWEAQWLIGYYSMSKYEQDIHDEAASYTAMKLL